MTLPSAESDLLMQHASRSRAPVAHVLFWRSEPARSTRWREVTRSWRTPSSSHASWAVTRSVRTACERDDSLFCVVPPTHRIAAPIAIRRAASAGELRGSCRSPSTTTRAPSSRMRSGAAVAPPPPAPLGARQSVGTSLYS